MKIFIILIELLLKKVLNFIRLCLLESSLIEKYKGKYFFM